MLISVGFLEIHEWICYGFSDQGGLSVHLSVCLFILNISLVAMLRGHPSRIKPYLVVEHSQKAAISVAYVVVFRHHHFVREPKLFL